jgi:hypothetical protein
VEPHIKRRISSYLQFTGSRGYFYSSLREQQVTAGESAKSGNCPVSDFPSCFLQIMRVVQHEIAWNREAHLRRAGSCGGSIVGPQRITTLSITVQPPLAIVFAPAKPAEPCNAAPGAAVSAVNVTGGDGKTVTPTFSGETTIFSQRDHNCCLLRQDRLGRLRQSQQCPLQRRRSSEKSPEERISHGERKICWAVHGFRG